MANPMPGGNNANYERKWFKMASNSRWPPCVGWYYNVSSKHLPEELNSSFYTFYNAENSFITLFQLLDIVVVVKFKMAATKMRCYDDTSYKPSPVACTASIYSYFCMENYFFVLLHWLDLTNIFPKSKMAANNTVMLGNLDRRILSITYIFLKVGLICIVYLFFLLKTKNMINGMQGVNNILN